MAKWVVDRALPAESMVYTADSVAIEHGGVLAFYNGSVFERELYLALAPGLWIAVAPYDEDAGDG